MLVMQHAPNHKINHFTDSTTSWQIIAHDGTGYNTLALLTAALKQPWPGGMTSPVPATGSPLDYGTCLQYLALRSENGSGADGSPFYFAVNRTTAPADNDAMLVSGGGQLQTIPGHVAYLWLRKTVAADEVVLDGGY